MPKPVSLLLDGPWWPHAEPLDFTVQHPPEEAFFRLRFPGGGPARLRLAASNYYQCWHDGVWLGTGPARDAHGQLTVDEFVLPAGAGTHEVAVQVFWEGLFTFDHVMGAPGLFCSVERDGVAIPVEILATARTGRLATHRFSRQRGWNEEVDHRKAAIGWPGGPFQAKQWQTPVRRAGDPRVTLRRRDIPNLDFQVRKARSVMFAGSADAVGRTPHRTLYYEGNPALAVPASCPSSRLQEEVLRPCLASDRNLAGLTGSGSGPAILGQDSRGLDRTVQLDFGGETSGLIDLAIAAPPGTVIDLGWSEGLWQDALMGSWASSCGQPEGSVMPRELCDARQGMRIVCRGGGCVEEHFGLFITAFRYLRLAVRVPGRRGAEVAVHRLQVRTVGYPVAMNAAFSCADHDLDRVFAAAVATVENSVSDTFMDCPGRERGGWLNDSYWTAAALFALSGDTALERRFLGQSILGQTAAGIVAPLYPSDCLAWEDCNQRPIGTHALYWLLQMERHLRLHGDAALRTAWKPALSAQFACFKRYENREGLLEKTPWDTYFDWSAIHNGDIQTGDNLLYALALSRLGRLYGEAAWSRRGARAAATIAAAAWSGGREMYTDTLARDTKGRLGPGRGVSGAINALALWSELVPPAKAQRVWRQLRNFRPLTMDHAPLHYETDFARSNAVALVYRFEYEGRNGLLADLLKDMKEAYLPMLARGQSCISEHLGYQSSLCHGYNGYVAVLLQRYIAGIELPGRMGGVVRIRPRPTTLGWCQARTPWMDGQVQVWWSRTADGCQAMVSLPKGQRGELIDPYTGRAIGFKEAVEWTGNPGGQRG